MEHTMKTFNVSEERNLRDLGGYPGENGRRIRPGLLYRSGALHLFHKEELDVLRTLGIHTILDLREAFSWKKKPDPEIGAVHAQYDGKPSKGAEQIDFTERGFSLTGQKAKDQLSRLYTYYEDMPFGYDAFHVMMKELKEGNTPFLFHCTKGKDRTGVAALILLLALGADAETAIEDYLYSNTARASLIKAKMKEARQIHPEDSDYLELRYLQEGVRQEVAERVIDGIITRCGSFEGYMNQEYGWSEEDIHVFREQFLE